jgi:hypothetical protein
MAVLRLLNVGRDRLRTCVTLALDIPRYLAISSLVSIQSVPILDFHCLARYIPSGFSRELGFLLDFVITTGFLSPKI